MVDFAGSHVVVTGGTGALGRAVIAALRAAGAVCHVPNLVAAELDDFPYASDPGVHIGRGVDLADEAAVRRFYQALPPLWASIHLAGGFAMAPIGEVSAAGFHVAIPDECAVVLLVLGCGRRCVPRSPGTGSRRRTGRANRQCRRTAGAGAAPRCRHGRLHRVKIGRGGPDPGVGARNDGRTDLGQCGSAFGARHSSEPGGNAGRRSSTLGLPNRPCRNDYLPGLTGQSRDSRRRYSGLRRVLSPTALLSQRSRLFT